MLKIQRGVARLILQLQKISKIFFHKKNISVRVYLIQLFDISHNFRVRNFNDHLAVHSLLVVHDLIYLISLGKSIDENHVCLDVDECSDFNDGQEICPNGRCINRDPGYICVCNPGFIPSQDQKTCLDAR